jgi:hypothetical protein
MNRRLRLTVRGIHDVHLCQASENGTGTKACGENEREKEKKASKKKKERKKGQARVVHTGWEELIAVVGSTSGGSVARERRVCGVPVCG